MKNSNTQINSCKFIIGQRQESLESRRPITENKWLSNPNFFDPYFRLDNENGLIIFFHENQETTYKLVNPIFNENYNSGVFSIYPEHLNLNIFQRIKSGLSKKQSIPHLVKFVNWVFSTKQKETVAVITFSPHLSDLRHKQIEKQGSIVEIR